MADGVSHSFLTDRPDQAVRRTPGMTLTCQCGFQRTDRTCSIDLRIWRLGVRVPPSAPSPTRSHWTFSRSTPPARAPRTSCCPPRPPPPTAGNGNGDAIFRPSDVPANLRHATHGVIWTVSDPSGTEFSTGCQVSHSTEAHRPRSPD